MIANSTATVTSVSAIAISGEATATTVERSARRSSTNCMLDLWSAAVALGVGAAHQQSEFLTRDFCSYERHRQAAVEHDGDTVRDFVQFVEILADDQHRGAAGGKIDQGLTDDRCRAGVNAPGRLADDENTWLAQNLAADDELLQVAAGKADGFRIALCLTDVERLGRAIDVSECRLPVNETLLHHTARGVAGEQRILRQFHPWCGAVAKPLLRYESDAHAAALCYAERAGSIAVDDDGAFTV